ncbi:hypothetical protein [Angustibacter sp. Root456]|nr:hypothetical protein [Angustibacter sp. Root456]
MTDHQPEPQIDHEPDKEHGDPVMEEFERDGAEERTLDDIGEGETQDGPA